MKVVFVCRANVGRSQMAAAIYRDLHPEDVVCSAGTSVDCSGETLTEYSVRHPGASFVVEVMQEVGTNLGVAVRRQLTPELLRGATRVVSMSEVEFEPLWLQMHPGYVHWEVRDPGGISFAATRLARLQIENLIVTYGGELRAA